MPGVLEIAGISGASLGLGAAALKLAQVWLEKRAAAPSKAQLAADAGAAAVSSAAELVPAVMAAARELMGDLQKEVDELRKAQAADRREIGHLKRAHQRCEADAEALRQRSRELEQKLDSLMRGLARGEERAGGALADAVIEMAGGEVNVTHTRPGVRKKS